MKQALLACFVVAFSILAALAHAVAIDPKPPKPIEILRLPRILLGGIGGVDLDFQIRIRGAVDEDRRVFAMLCEDGWPCSTKFGEHVQWSELPIEGSAAPRLWAFKKAPWHHIGAGAYQFVAGIGPTEGIRYAESLTLTVQGF